MACFPHGFQFREQSREKNKKRWENQVLFLTERTLVRFFGKLKDAAKQANTTPLYNETPPTHVHPPNLFLFQTPILLGLCYRGWRSAGRGRERSSRLCRSHPTAPCLSCCHCDVNEGRLLGRDRSCPWSRTMGAEWEAGLATGKKCDFLAHFVVRQAKLELGEGMRWLSQAEHRKLIRYFCPNSWIICIFKSVATYCHFDRWRVCVRFRLNWTGLPRKKERGGYDVLK